MDQVFVHRARYDDESLRPTVSAMLGNIGRLVIERSSRVLIKPNFLAPARPERAMTTHPLVLRAAAEYVLSKGASVLVADSPGMGSFDRLLREGGYAEALKGLDLEIRPFRQTVAVDIGEPFGRIELAREAVAADVLINLPKLKTHAMMLMTLGVKNLFGCVVGLEKPRWHMRSGVSREMFARLLVQICRALDPAATLVDGILGMEGQGPGRSGSPRSLGFLAAGGSAPAVDQAVCRLVGVEPGLLPTHTAAAELGLVPAEVTIVGDPSPVAGFRLPVLGPLTFGPRRLQPLLRRHLVQRPMAERSRCRMCGECLRCCPAAAVSADAGAIRFDYDRCIRCYCCVEMCPHGALAVVETAPGMVLRRLTALRGRLAAGTGPRRLRRREE